MDKRGSQEGRGSRGSRDSDKKVRIRLKTDPTTDPRSIKAPKNKSAMKKDDNHEHEESEVSRTKHDTQSTRGHSSEESLWQIASARDVKEKRAQEVSSPESNKKEHEVERKPSRSSEKGKNEENVEKDDAGKEIIIREIDTNNADDDDKIRVQENESTPLSETLKVIEDSTKERKSGDGKTSTQLSLKSSNQNAEGKREANPLMEGSALSFPKESEMANEGANKVNPSTDPTTLMPVPEQTDDVIQHKTSLIDTEEQLDPLPAQLLTQGSTMMSNENARMPEEKSDITVGKEDPSSVTSSPDNAVGSKTNVVNGENLTGEVDANKEMRKSSTSSITGRIRQSIEKLIMKDDQSKQISTSSNENKNLSTKQESSFTSNSLKIDDTKKKSIEGDYDGDPNEAGQEKKYLDGGGGMAVAEVSAHNQEGIKDTPTKATIKVRRKTNEEQDEMNEKEQSKGTIQKDERNTENMTPSKITMSSSLIETSQMQTDNEIVEAEKDSPKTDDETTILKQEEPSQKQIDMQDNGIADSYQKSENVEEGTINNGKDDPEKRKDGNDSSVPILLKRTSGSEDLKITELKDRVRPGQVFIVRGETESFTVKWAEKRKVLAYKVGSKNTSRFSSVLIETVEQLEKASVRHPSILSEFTHPTEPSQKGSILSSYLAGANTRRSIKDHLIRDAGTNTDNQIEFTARGNSPDVNFWATDHVSPDKETFGGAEKVQTHEGDTKLESNNYNYPFLTDYDINHKRESKK